MELLKNSPYKNQLGTAGLFLKQLAAEQKQLPSLISANVGNQVFMATQLIQAAPPLQPMKLDQITALPLGIANRAQFVGRHGGPGEDQARASTFGARENAI